MTNEMDKALHRLPSWIVYWFYTTAIICTYDATFIVMRPLTLPGGPLFGVWYLYQFYYQLDKRYVDMTDAFVYSQSLLNYVEVVLNIVTLVMHYKNSQHTRIMAFTVSVMTFWKTVLYFLMFSDYCGADTYRDGNSAIREFFLVVIPNGVWIVLPFLVMVALWVRMTIPGQGQKDDSMYGNRNGQPTVDGSSKANMSANGVTKRKGK